MFTRTRDKLPNFKPQEKVSAENWEKICDRYVIAKGFLNSDNPIYQILAGLLETNKNLLLENKLKEVREEKLTDTLRRIFVTPKKVQEDEVVGQIKLTKNLFEEIESWIKVKEEIERRESTGITVIEREKK